MLRKAAVLGSTRDAIALSTASQWQSRQSTHISDHRRVSYLHFALHRINSPATEPNYTSTVITTMASNLQAKNFPKGSYRAYTSLLKQYSGPGKSTTPLSTAEKLSPVQKEAELPTLSISNGATKTARLNIEALLALTNGEIDMLDTAVLRQFLELLTKENQFHDKSALMVDANNNNNDQPQNGLSGGELDIESSKHNLIQSLKAQLERYRQE